MATVFLATDLRHKRSVALKGLHPELAHTLGPERFQREIETVPASVVPLTDLGQSERGPGLGDLNVVGLRKGLQPHRSREAAGRACRLRRR